MFILRPARIVAVSMLLGGTLLSGCAHNSPSEVAKDVAIGVAEAVYVKDCIDVPGRRDSSCEQKFEDNVKLGQSVYEELSPDEDSSDASELSRDLDAFIERKRTPDGYGEDRKAR